MRMTGRDREILEQFANVLVPEIQAVSKRFAPTVESEIEVTPLGWRMTITASEFITTLIDGRPPTRPNAPRGPKSLQEILLEWAKNKGIKPYPRPNGVIPTIESVSWAMANSMHKKGDLLYQAGGGNNIFDPIITNARIDSLFSIVADQHFLDAESEVLREFKVA